MLWVGWHTAAADHVVGGASDANGSVVTTALSGAGGRREVRGHTIGATDG